MFLFKAQNPSFKQQITAALSSLATNQRSEIPYICARIGRNAASRMSKALSLKYIPNASGRLLVLYIRFVTPARFCGSLPWPATRARKTPGRYPGRSPPRIPWPRLLPSLWSRSRGGFRAGGMPALPWKKRGRRLGGGRCGLLRYLGMLRRARRWVGAFFGCVCVCVRE